jgi:molybdate transport system substrate-binding protein
MRAKVLTLTAAAAVAVTMVAACSSSGTKSAAASSTPPASPAASSSSPSPTSTPVTGTIIVLAASSLTKAFTTLAQQFEAANPGATVKVTYDASSALATDINQGDPADVFASASPTNMKQVVTAGGATTSTNFVKNTMAIVTPPSNPKAIATVADLAKAGVKLAICEAQVPCGATANMVFANAKVTVKPVTLEANDAATLTVVESGEVDAGVVYTTDVLAAGAKVKGIDIPDDINASTEYPIAALTKAPNPTGAQAFVAYILSAAGQAVLTADGFAAP